MIEEKEREALLELAKETESSVAEQQEPQEGDKRLQMVFSKQIRKMLNIKFVPYKRESAKVRRNEKCPCNSGLKYKHCCGKNIEMKSYINTIAA